MTKRVDMTVDKCILCNTVDTYLYTGEDAEGLIFSNALCIDCEEKAEAMMDEQERIQTLFRWTFGG